MLIQQEALMEEDENIYEEIRDVPPQQPPATKMKRKNFMQNLLHRRSLVDEVLDEVKKVQWKHAKVLGELNLDVEAMIMPQKVKSEGGVMFPPVGPTDELLSPRCESEEDELKLNRLASYDVPVSCSEPRKVLHAKLSKCESLDAMESGSSGGGGSSSSAFTRKRSVDRESRKSASSKDSASAKQTKAKKSWKFPNLTQLLDRSGSQDLPSFNQQDHAKVFTESEKDAVDPGGGGSDTAIYEELDQSEGVTRRLAARRQASYNGSWGSLNSSASTSSEDSTAQLDYTSDSFRAKILKRGADTNSSAKNNPFGRWLARRSQHIQLKEQDMLPQEEDGLVNTLHRRAAPPCLPPIPVGLTPEQVKRRAIIASLVHSENSYVASLQRLVKEYKKDLEESQPMILSQSKIAILFRKLAEILQIHNLFRIALGECVKLWDRQERIGDVFVASFSKAVVLDTYSDFINNFSTAMDVAKQEAKRKSAFADFLKVKQITSPDRLGFFGLMVKPVQRFPQFMLQLQDLLKHTPTDHHDRMSLQLALTQLESLAEMLNERKRESEQYLAFRDTLKHISAKFALRSLHDSNRYLLRQDHLTQLEFSTSGSVSKCKPRRLYLLNDLLVCVNVNRKDADESPSERLSLKWSVPITEVEVVDNSTSPTLSRLISAGIGRAEAGRDGVEGLCQDMKDLMHDYEVVKRIGALIKTMKGQYPGLTTSACESVCDIIQNELQTKDDEIAQADSCCLQLSISREPNNVTFQTPSATVKKDWIAELRLAQLALDPDNSPAWDVPENERPRPSAKMPLFVKSHPVLTSQHSTEACCGTYYACSRNPKQCHLWVGSTDGVGAYITLFSHQPQHGARGLKELHSAHFPEVKVTAMQAVPSYFPHKSDSVWMGTDSHRIWIYSFTEPDKLEEVGTASVSAGVVSLCYHLDSVWVALNNGTIAVFRRDWEGEWGLASPMTVNLSPTAEPVSCLLPIQASMYAACGSKVWLLDACHVLTTKSFVVQHESLGGVHLMAHSGIGLWVSLKNSSTICLYHTETFRHLQDINIASNVNRILSAGGGHEREVTVTSLMACRGLLWIGTNVGISLTIPLPRLEGVPIISGRANISYHAHCGPIHLLLPLDIRTSRVEHVPQESRLEKQQSDTSLLVKKGNKLKAQLSSPAVRQKSRDHNRRTSKTLPRGMGLHTTSQECSVYGLYGDLFNTLGYEEDSTLALNSGTLRRSDPELVNTLASKVNTLDKRVKLKTSRPRSLDLSNWSVDSTPSSLCTSSGSEGEGLASQASTTSSEAVVSQPSISSNLDKSLRTLVTITGGRGYVNRLRKPSQDKSSKYHNMPSNQIRFNGKDSHIVLWEMKL